MLPLTKLSTAYWLLRPFFAPSASAPHDLGAWNLDVESLYLHGATPGRGQEFSATTHPHLDLGSTVVSIPRVQPGDVVMWHGDSIHACVTQCPDYVDLLMSLCRVESKHDGTGDSSVLCKYVSCTVRVRDLIGARQIFRQYHAHH